MSVSLNKLYDIATGDFITGKEAEELTRMKYIEYLKYEYSDWTEKYFTARLTPKAEKMVRNALKEKN